MKHYRYVGTGPFLTYGLTALGRRVDGVFKVQLDDFCHPWSHGWHKTSQGDWKEIE